tara:strand:- start:4566 stop:6446 length:1881 start_codon:yes stop_codon:yes gene_type:complete
MHLLALTLLCIAGFVLIIPFVVYFTSLGTLIVPADIHLNILNKDDHTLNGIYAIFLLFFLSSIALSLKNANINQKFISWIGANNSKYEFTEVKVLTYIYVLVFVHCLIFLAFFDFTAFEWSTSGEINSILRLADNSFLLNDFYTNSIQDSPKYIFSFFIHLFSFLGLGWYEVLYFIKWSSAISVPPLLFLLYVKVNAYWNTEISSNETNKIYPIIFLGLLGPFCILQLVPRMDPFGWGAIQYFTAADPMRISFVFGLIFLILNFLDKPYMFPRIVFLFIATLFHPAVGICNYIVSANLVLTKKISKGKLLEFCIVLFFSVLIPTFIIYIFFDSNDILTSQEFFNIYILSRHPHHYLMSEIFDIHSFVWILLMLLPVMISIQLKNKKLIILACVSFTLIMLSILLQYFFSEIIPNKLIMKAGPSRYTSYLSLILTLNLVIIFSFMQKSIYLDKLKNNYIYDIFKVLAFKINKLFSYLENFYIKKKIHLFSCFLVVISSFIFTFASPERSNKDGSTFRTLTWLKYNTPLESVVFSPIGSLDPALIRIYSERAIFADWMFPFSEKYMKEFHIKYNFYKRSENFLSEEYSCMYLDQIDYLIVKTDKDELNEALFKSDIWSIYDVSKLSCF